MASKSHIIWDAPWKMVKSFGDSGDGKLLGAVGVAINKDGNVAVADREAKRINVYGIDDGVLKLSIDTTKKSLHSMSEDCESYPMDVAVAHDGNYILSDQTESLTIYDKKGNYVRQIPIKAIMTTGISINSQNHVLVGDRGNLSVYNYSDGAFISRVKTIISPSYISASSNDHTSIISGHGSAHIIDAKGQTIHKIRPPKDVKSHSHFIFHGFHFGKWYLHGGCTIGEGEEEEVLICEGEESKVYRFSLSTGEYLGCVGLELNNPRSIVFTDDGKLVVAELDGVKIFMPNTQ